MKIEGNEMKISVIAISAAIFVLSGLSQADTYRAAGDPDDYSPAEGRDLPDREDFDHDNDNESENDGHDSDSD